MCYENTEQRETISKTISTEWETREITLGSSH